VEPIPALLWAQSRRAIGFNALETSASTACAWVTSVWTKIASLALFRDHNILEHR
jgi:hypothetical protein